VEGKKKKSVGVGMKKGWVDELLLGTQRKEKRND
jgi:hypothetical protein